MNAGLPEAEARQYYWIVSARLEVRPCYLRLKPKNRHNQLIGIAQRCSHQQGIHVLRHLLQFAVGEAEDEAIPVVVRVAALGCIVAPGLDHDHIILGNESLWYRPDPV